jgi:acyl-CoA dehydrogenase
MDFQPTERQAYWRDRVKNFIDDHIRPAVPTYKQQDAEGERWKVIPVVEELKAKAKKEGIWNLFMPPRNDGHHHVEESFEFEGPGLTNLEYALCAEEMGRIGRDRHGQDRFLGWSPCRAVDDPDADGRAGRKHPAPPARVRL